MERVLGVKGVLGVQGVKGEKIEVAIVATKKWTVMSKEGDEPRKRQEN